MLKEERQQHILERLRREGKVLASALCTELHVSEDTVRRDLQDLADMSMIQRVHGGALLRTPVLSYAVRQDQALSAKAEIARAALRLVRNGQVIVMDGGTTTIQVAHHFPTDLHATVITNSPPLAVALSEHPYVELLLLGGRLAKEALVTVGVETVTALRSFRADLCFLGVCSLHPEVGISIPDLDEVYTKRTMIECSAEVAALASAEKLTTADSYVVGPLQDLTHLVTEQSVADDVLAPYRALGITIVQP
ncbi:MAG TPA: DeoR/GlpR family DNA-binding transcription regulator [Ktedonobacteraceae bacterium]|nr:DeoR/GlpR family DNA-binding transcription regulator [Ktedonobacteraceae bacterium]